MKKSTLFYSFSIVLTIFLVLFSLASGQDGPTVEWIAVYNGPGNGEDYISDLAIDPLGNVYVTGPSYGIGTNYDFATIKYDRDGNEIWMKRYNGLGNYWDRAQSIAVDPMGNVYVTGESSVGGTGLDYDYATIKYDKDGNEIWVKSYNGPENYMDCASDLVVDHTGNIYVTGNSHGITTDWDFATIKYDKDGNEIWVARYNGPGNGYDALPVLTVDPVGNIYVTGESLGIGTYSDYATIKYDRDGNEIWVARYNSPSNRTDRSKSIAVDHRGNVFVTGYSPGIGTSRDYTTVKYDRDGNEIWVARYNGPGNFLDYATDIAVDHRGNIFVTGYSAGTWGDYHSNTIYDSVTIKYDRNGKEIWVAKYSGPGNGYDGTHSIAIDPSGNIYVTGMSYGSGTADDTITIKYDRDGKEVWVARHNGPGNGNDFSGSIISDPLGNVYIAGGRYVIETDFDFLLIKYGKNTN